MSPICTVQKIISTIENISFILYVYYCHLNHLFCQILVGTPIIIIIIVIILLDLHSFDTPHIPTVTFLTVLEVDSVDTYGWWKNNLLVNGPAFILHLRPIWVRSQRIRKNTSQRSLSHQSRLPASTNFLKVFCLYDTLAFEYPSHYLWDDPAGYTYSLESAVTTNLVKEF